MPTNDNLPSIFDPESELNRPSQVDAPSFITLITAHVLGALIAERVIAYQGDAWSAINQAERAIAEAAERAIDNIDMIELIQAHEARTTARTAHRDAAGRLSRPSESSTAK